MALDEGSTSARAVLVDPDGTIVAEARNPVVPNFPRPGWVELDPVALWQAQRASMAAVMARVGATTNDIAAIGVTTHRETCLIWDRRTGEPVYPALMWMSKQTDAIVARWRADGSRPAGAGADRAVQRFLLQCRQAGVAGRERRRRARPRRAR